MKKEKTPIILYESKNIAFDWRSSIINRLDNFDFYIKNQNTITLELILEWYKNEQYINEKALCTLITNKYLLPDKWHESIKNKKTPVHIAFLGTIYEINKSHFCPAITILENNWIQSNIFLKNLVGQNLWIPIIEK